MTQEGLRGRARWRPEQSVPGGVKFMSGRTEICPVGHEFDARPARRRGLSKVWKIEGGEVPRPGTCAPENFPALDNRAGA